MAPRTLQLFVLVSIISLLHINLCFAQTSVRAAYWFPGSEFPVSNIDSTKFTHLFYAFANLDSQSKQVTISSSDAAAFSQFTETVQVKNPNVKTLLSIGGGNSKSTDFAAMASQSASRKAFIDSSIRLARSNGFYGLDLDWQYPLVASDMTNLGLLLDEWRAAVNNEARSKRLLLSAAVSYKPDVDGLRYPVGSISRNLDWINVMAYDFFAPNRSDAKVTNSHAALYDPSSARISARDGIEDWIGARVPEKKLVLGLPFYGYAWRLVDANNHGIGAPANGPLFSMDGSIGYNRIKEFIAQNRATAVYNSTVGTDYCYSGTTWIGYDDTRTISAKVSFAKQKGLLGYFAWHVAADSNWALSKQAFEEEEEGGDQLKKKLLLVAVLPAIGFSILLCTIVYCRKKKIIKLKVSRTKASFSRLQSPSLQVFSFAYMKAATENFSEAKKLGEGGFGPVYKGNLMDGQEIAVKRLAGNSKQGSEEFKNELVLAAKLQHVNLLRLLGFCNEGKEKLLIYEFMPNKSLDFYLYDPIRHQLLDWEKRVGIIEGIIQGLLYLQEYSIYTVIHRDLKASNILLDNEMKPKISDFGIARIFRKDEHEAETSRIMGTYGYVPPEYVKRGMYSKKYDVYSFGVLLLQIVSGKRNSSLYSEQKNLTLLEYAYQSWKDGNASEFLDPSFDDASSSCKIIRCLHVALLCVQEKWEDRPSMLEIYSMLKNETETLPTPKMPAFSTTENEDAEKEFRSGENLCSVNTTTMSEVFPR